MQVYVDLIQGASLGFEVVPQMEDEPAALILDLFIIRIIIQKE